MSGDGEHSQVTSRLKMPRTSTILLIIVGLLFLWYVAKVVLLLFAGLLFAVILSIPTNFLTARTPLSRPWALTLILLIFLGGLAGGIVTFAPTIDNQIDQLINILPQGREQINQIVVQYEWLPQLSLERLSVQDMLPSTGSFLSRITGIFSGLAGLSIDLLLFMVIGLFFAFQPKLYINGLVKLFPRHTRQRVYEVIEEIGYSLKWWLLSRTFAMLIIGVFTGLGLWVLDVPFALSLGIVSGFLNFVPFIGTFLALIPVGLVVITQGLDILIYVLIFYTVVQNVETYLLTPIVQEHAVSIPPALALTTQLLMGILTGFLGFLLAVPLTATALVLVKLLYIEDVLGDKADLPHH